MNLELFTAIYNVVLWCIVFTLLGGLFAQNILIANITSIVLLVWMVIGLVVYCIAQPRQNLPVYDI